MWALRHINLAIEQGEYVAFFGPSGCGKTTFLYVVAGIERPDEGEVLVNARDIAHLSNRELAIYRQIGVGIVFQQFNLIPSLTVVENVALPMSFLGISPNKRAEEALRLLDRLGIQELTGRYPFELSGGQQQRVGIARALANNAPIIVADEPLGNLDSENAKKVLEFLKELNEQDGRTIIMVTHEAWSLRDAKRVFYMKDGTITNVEAGKGSTRMQSLSTFFYKELYPEVSQGELVARSLSHLFLRGYSTEEIKRFEFFLLQRMQRAIDADTFRELLDRPFKEGGVGLWRQKAKAVSGEVEKVIEERKDVNDLLRELEANPARPFRDEVQKIRVWLLEHYAGAVSDLQKMQLDEIIMERIRKVITPDHFQAILNLSKKKSGIGLSLRASKTIAEKMETILEDGAELRAAGAAL